jgi:hypothetical protein
MQSFRPTFAAMALLPVAASLYVAPPGRVSFYPRCLFHEATGLFCPGCGATRALAALLHGHITEALHLNLLIVMLVPVATLYLVFALRRAEWPRIPVPVSSALLAVAFLFTILRNIH